MEVTAAYGVCSATPLTIPPDEPPLLLLLDAVADELAATPELEFAPDDDP